MNWRLIFLGGITLILAAIIHIAIILLIPVTASQDAWAYLASYTRLNSFTRLEQGEANALLSNLDPFFVQGICRFDLSQNGMKMTGPASKVFWSASVFDETGSVIFSFNSRSAINEAPNILIMDPLLALETKQNNLDEIENAIVVEAQVEFGFVILRALKANESYSEEVDNFIEQIECEQFDG